MKAIIILLSLAPTIFESWTDRKGEQKKDKKTDAVLLVAYSALLAGASWGWLGYNPLSVLLLILGFRISIFDYLVNYLLKKNGVISPTANVWTYAGNTSWWDKFIRRINWKIRILLRCVVFVVSIVYFFL